MKMYLNDFKELTMAELLSVNGGYTVTTNGYSTSGGTGSYASAGGTGSYPTAGGTGSYSAYSATTPTGTPHSTVPEGYSPTSGWLPGWGPDGYTDPNQPSTPIPEVDSTPVNPLGSGSTETGGFGSSYDANGDGVPDLHTGVDIVSATREVSSTRSGVVLYSGVHPDGTGVATGTLVIIQYDDGNYGVYGHMDPNDLDVSAGDTVTGGSSLGTYYDGAMGMSTGGHLHYSEFSGSLTATGDDLARQFNRTGYVYGGTGEAAGATLWNGLTVVEPNF